MSYEQQSWTLESSLFTSQILNPSWNFHTKTGVFYSIKQTPELRRPSTWGMSTGRRQLSIIKSTTTCVAFFPGRDWSSIFDVTLFHNRPQTYSKILQQIFPNKNRRAFEKEDAPDDSRKGRKTNRSHIKNQAAESHKHPQQVLIANFDRFHSPNTHWAELIRFVRETTYSGKQ